MTDVHPTAERPRYVGESDWSLTTFDPRKDELGLGDTGRLQKRVSPPSTYRRL